jgi:hypothetical protein
MNTRNLLALHHGRTVWLRPRRVRGSTPASVRIAGDPFPGAGQPAPPVVDLEIENRETRSVVARLVFQEESGAETSAILTLAAGETLRIGDAVAGWLGVPAVSGDLSVESFEEDAADPIWSVRVYPRPSTAPRPAPSSSAPDGNRWIADVSEADGASTELSAVNRTAATRLFAARLRSADGASIAVREDLSVEPGEQKTWLLGELFFGAAGRGLSLEFAPAGGSALPDLRAAVATSAADAPAVFGAERPGARFFLPAAGRAAGSEDRYLATDVALSNAGDDALSVRATFLETDRDNAAAPAVLLLLGPRETRRIADVVGSLFGLEGTSGQLQLEAERSDLVVSARLSARSDSSPDEISAALVPARDSELSAASLLLAPSGASSPIAGLDVLNPDSTPNPVSLLWLDESGEPVAEGAAVLPPRGLLHFPVPEAVLGSAVSVLIQTERAHFAYFGRTDRIFGLTDVTVPRNRVIVR